ncbi:MAG: MopE-related protein [Pseudomonadota bacterium]
MPALERGFSAVLLVFSFAVACKNDAEEPPAGRPPAPSSTDDDGDGYSEDEWDCDDDDPWLTPEDRDGDGFSTCDGDCDDNDAFLNSADEDRDGFSTCDGDCDDGSRWRNPVDADRDGFSTCDGDCDDGEPLLNPRDVDRDGYSTCEGDCDDGDPLLNPRDADHDGFSTCDGDCDDGDPLLNLQDADHDGFSTCDGDCNDSDAAQSPGAWEIWYDGVDQDCDGASDYDQDGDGYESDDCGGDDCDDADAEVNPEAAESCNGKDDDCDGRADEDDAIDLVTWYLDEDGDGYGIAVTIEACDRPAGYAAAPGDCDEASREVHPWAVELDDGVDNDCDGCVDADCTACTSTVPTDHATIQDALDVATDGDVICVAPGTYRECIDFGGVEVRLFGIGGPADTIIECTGSSSAVTFASAEGPGAILEGFTVSGGDSSFHGGGILVEGASPSLVDLIVTGNEVGWYGGGVYLGDSSALLQRVRISGNVAWAGDYYGWGAGLGAIDSDVLLTDVIISDNWAWNHGGGLYAEASSLRLVNVDLTDNYADIYGGAAFSLDSRLDLENVAIWCNHANGGDEGGSGGLRLLRSEASLTASVVAQNISSARVLDQGAGIYAGSSTLVLTNTAVVSNTLHGGSPEGGGIYATSDSTVTLVSSDAWGNSDGDYAGFVDPTGTAGNLSVDPEFLDIGSGSCWDDPFGRDLHLAVTSPLIDAGDPDILDPDGSPSDIGIYGGAAAGSWDLDGDGYNAWWLAGAYDAATSPGTDCDDGDATISTDCGS